MSDPRKIRPIGPTSEQTSYDAEEDPLVELARIVSEDSGFSGRRAEKVRPQREEVPPRNISTADLEAELLQELESSFAAQQAGQTRQAEPEPQPRPKLSPTASVQPLPRPRPAEPVIVPAPVTPREEARPRDVEVRPRHEEVRPRADVVAPEDQEADDLLRSIEEQLGQFERRAQAAHLAPVADEDDGQEATDDMPLSPPVTEWKRPSRMPAEEPTIPFAAIGGKAEYRFRGPAADRRGASQYDASVDPAEEPRRPEAWPEGGGTAGARIQAARPEAVERARAAPAFDPAETFAKRSVRELRPSADEFRRESWSSPNEAAARDFAESNEAHLTNLEAEISREFEPRYADPSFASRPQVIEDEDEAPRVASVAAAREQIGRAPGREEGRKRARGGSRKGLLTAASVIVVAAVGAAGAMYLRTAEQAPSGPPPVIEAPEGAVKVEASEAQLAEEGETVGEAVYNRVAGNAPDAEEQVVDSSEEPREIARIVLPSQAEDESTLMRPVGEEEATASASDPSGAAREAAVEDEIGPRRVQTFTVRPDGTIVSTEATEVAGDPAADQQEQLAAQTEQIEPVPVATVAITDPSQAAEPPTPALRPTAPAPVGQSEPTESAPPPATAAIEPSEALPAADLPAESAPEAASAPTEQVAAPQQPAAVPAPSTGGGYLVQVSSQRSQEQAEAAYADLQGNYPSVLGGLNASVQQADLGEKGIYYRVRVGPWATREEAVAICESLQNAGGTCFVTE